MSHVARNIAQELLESIQKNRKGDREGQSLRNTLLEQLGRIHAKEFAPVAQPRFLVLVDKMNRFKRDMTMDDDWMDRQMLRDLVELFDEHYGAARSTGRKFTYVKNADLRKIIERDYSELETRLFPTQAWKSVVIMAGSVLEAVLYDLLTNEPAAVTAAMSATAAPKKRGGSVRDITLDTYEDEWKLNDMIKVAAELKIIRPDDERTTHAVLREYRNLVHPRVELKGASPVGEAEATASKGMLDIILNYLTP